MPTPAKTPLTTTPAPEPEVVVEDFHKSFGEHAVLRGVNLTIHRGELVAIVGGSGSGKTVLLKSITGHFTPDQGRILLADHESPKSPTRDLATLTEEELDRIRRHWAVVFQRNALLTGTVFYNLALWPREIHQMTDEQIMPLARSAIQSVGMNPDEVLQRDRDALSGGMGKRVAIARAIVMDPVLILYDEPSSGLDPESAGQIHDLIQKTHQTKPAFGVPRTSIVVTHDTQLLRRLQPRVVMLHDGGVLFDGSFDAFAASDNPHIRPYIAQMPALHARRPLD